MKKTTRTNPIFLFTGVGILFFALGMFVCSSKILPMDLRSGLFAGIVKTSFGDFLSGFLLNLVPLCVTILSGFDLIGDVYSSLSIAFLSFFSGYSLSSVMWAYEKFSLFVFVIFLILESLIILTLISSSVDSSKIRRFLISRREKSDKKKAIWLFLSHAAFRIGILFGFYLLRCLCARFIL